MDPDSTSTATEPPDADTHDNSDIAVVILTAGRGTRMRSALPKVLHPIAGIPMVEHVLRAAERIQVGQIIFTIGPTSEVLQDRYADRADFAWQEQPLGTGDAVRSAMPLVESDVEWVVVIFGDHPLVDAATLQALMTTARQEQPILTTVGVVLDDPGPYGRYRFENDRIVGITEAHEDSNTYDNPIPVNSGMCCVRREWLDEHIGRLTLSPKGEYYLTELVELAARTDWPRDPVALHIAEREVAWGINDRVELATAERVIRRRVNAEHMRAGVTIVDPDSTYIDMDIQIGQDTRIEPNCTLRGRTRVGVNCCIGPNTVVEDSTVGNQVVVRASWIEGSEIGDRVDIGPYAHFRPGTRIASDVHIGNYVEIKNARIGSGTAIGHVSYVGDADIGERVNIGAGTITCNFDGKDKHHTAIGDDVFVGSDTMLVAPVTLGDGSRTGAGAVVTRSVEAGKLVVGMPARPIPATRITEVEE